MLDRGLRVDPALVSAALQALPVPAMVTDPAGRILHANAALARLTGYGEDELLGRDSRLLRSPRTDPAVAAELRARITGRRGFRGDVLTRRKDGSDLRTSLVVTPVHDQAGETRAFVGVLADVDDPAPDPTRTRALTAEVLLATASGLAAAVSADAVAQSLANGVVGAGAERAIAVLTDSRTSATRVRVAGWPDPEQVARDVTALVGDPRGLEVALSRAHGITRLGEAGSRIGALMVGAQVDRYFVEPVIAGRGVQGLLIGCWTGAADDAAGDELVIDRVSRLAELGAVAFENVALIEQIRAAADEDQLTGVLSRSRIRELLQRAVRDERSRVGVLYVDVDRFKRLNDSLGHAGGDALLVQVAARLRDAVGSRGAVGRPGGDEFVVVLPDAPDREAVEAVAERIDRAVRDGFVVLDRAVHATASVGWALGGRALLESSAEAADRLIGAADRAMYLVKDRRRSRRRPETHLDVVDVEALLHDAVRAGTIRTAFQPEFDLRTGRLSGFEALARWTHERLGDVPAGVFIPLAEEAGLITELGDVVLRSAADFLDRVDGDEPLRLHVNVSAHQLADPAFLGRLTAVLDEHPDRTWTLAAEIAEPDLALDGAVLLTAVRRLRELQVDVTIDAFGSGSTALQLLQDLPVTAIKIDESFVRRAGALGSGMLGAIVTVARSLGLDVVAEGVETPEQLAALQRLGCDRAQGSLLGPPLPADRAAHAPRTVAAALAGRADGLP